MTLVKVIEASDAITFEKELNNLYINFSARYIDIKETRIFTNCYKNMIMYSAVVFYVDRKLNSEEDLKYD